MRALTMLPGVPQSVWLDSVADPPPSAALNRAYKRWLARLITRRVPFERFAQALEHRRGDIKAVIDFVQ